MPSTRGLRPAFTAIERSLGQSPHIAGLYEAGTGAPLLLIHSINAAASAYEIKPIFEDLSACRHVFALELPGFGRAERSRLARYDTELYVGAILDAVQLIRRQTGWATVDVLGLSISCEFIARAAVQSPDDFGRLIFVTPTGFQRGSSALRKKHQPSRKRTLIEKILRFPLWSTLLFRGFTIRPVVQFFLRRTFGGREVNPDLIDYAYNSAHQPNAAFAPWAFVSGKLFSSDIRSVYEALIHRVWLAHGTKGPFCDFSEAGWTDDRPNWRRTMFDTGAFPHFEKRAKFAACFIENLAAQETSA